MCEILPLLEKPHLDPVTHCVSPHIELIEARCYRMCAFLWFLMVYVLQFLFSSCFEQSKSSPVNQTALDTLFITVNYEENKSSEEAKENDDRALMR